MASKIVSVVICAYLLDIASAAAADLRFDSDRMAVINGQRTFVIGLYENPKDDSVLRQAAAAGINLVQATEDAASLDRLKKAGVWAWLNVGSRIDLSADAEARRAALDALVNGPVGKHPGLLVWEIPDEALWNCWYQPFLWRREQEPKEQRKLIDEVSDTKLAGELRDARSKATQLFLTGKYEEAEEVADELWARLGKPTPHPDWNISTSAMKASTMREGLLSGYQHVKRIDQSHPIWMNHAPRNSIAQLAGYGAAADIVGCDIYPIPEYRGGHSDLSDRAVTACGAYTERMQTSAPGKPVWMVLQGFGWPDIGIQGDDSDKKHMRRPNLDELRFMVYDTIVHGGRGVLFWGTYAIEKDSQLWNDILSVVSELHALSMWLAAPDAVLSLDVKLSETLGSLDKGVMVLPKRTPAGLAFIIINEWSEPLEYSITGIPADSSRILYEALTAEPYSMDGDALRSRIGGNRVQVFVPSPQSN